MTSKASKGIVALADLVVTVFYLLFVALVSAAIVVFVEPLGVQPLALFGGMGLFGVIMALDLAAVLIFDKITPFVVLFMSPGIIVYIAVKQAADSKMIRDFIERIESTIRSPIYLPVR